MAPVTRTWAGYLFDRYSTRSFGLPAEKCSYSIETVRIPMSDGVGLLGDIYRPSGSEKPVGTLMARGPYGRDPLASLVICRIFAARGYQVLHVSVRGTAGSEGEWVPGVRDTEDGRDIVHWMREQDWYTGSFATIGASYLGYLQWTLLGLPEGPPPDMKTAIILTGFHDLKDFLWNTGTFNPMKIAWARFMRNFVVSSWEPMLVDVLRIQSSVPKSYNQVPLIDAIDGLWKEGMPQWLRTSLTIKDDPRWDLMAVPQALQAAQIPLLLTTGWYDLFRDQVLDEYAILSKRGAQVNLIVGPWTHVQVGGGQGYEHTIFQWAEQYLTGKKMDKPIFEAPLRMYVTGAEEWRNMQSWPPVTNSKDVYLLAGKRLSDQKPSEEAGESSFVFDPSNPTPTVGCPGAYDPTPDIIDTTLAVRSDVISFTGPSLQEEIEILGRPAAELYHSTSTPFADLLVRLSDVDPRGVSKNIADAYIRFDEQKAAGPVELTMGQCAHRFLKGHQMRVTIAGGAHSRFIRNLGSGEDWATGTTLKSVTHTVSHHGGAISKVILPVANSEN